MTRFILTILIIVCLAISSAFCQVEYNETIAEQMEKHALELTDKLRKDVTDATTVEQIEKQVQKLTDKLYDEITDNTDEISRRIKYLTISGIQLAGGEKILKIANNDEERERGYWLKITAFKIAINSTSIKGLSKIKIKYEEKLSTLLKELEKEGKQSRLVNNERYGEFASRIFEDFDELTIEKFAQIKKNLQQWVNKIYEPIRPIKITLLIIDLSSLSKKYPDLVPKTVQELITFVNSSECIISAKHKKEALEIIEGYSRRCRGSSLNLYGKTLDNKDFNWNALRGKYVLVMFTATWCGVCKNQYPEMFKAYEKYHDKGLEIVSIYVQDELDKVKKEVKKEKLPWLIVSEELTEKVNQPPQKKTYFIDGVPVMLLVDKEGNVIETWVRDEKLPLKLAEVFDPTDFPF